MLGNTWDIWPIKSDFTNANWPTRPVNPEPMRYTTATIVILFIKSEIPVIDSRKIATQKLTEDRVATIKTGPTFGGSIFCSTPDMAQATADTRARISPVTGDTIGENVKLVTTECHQFCDN